MLAPVVQVLMAMRGICLVNVVTLLAEFGDPTWFQSPRQLMVYLGLVPSEPSSGNRERRGPITKTGNARVRKALAESTWTSRFPPRKIPEIRRLEAVVLQPARDIGWKAQRWLYHRFRHLMRQGKFLPSGRDSRGPELAGFLWALARETTPKGAQA
ncbi:transposase [Thiohalorhabdus methylotrophus]|uniref:Transposase n=1 Tax=Thiohalorhabdus methylotrophus TaxID=3242694 RepID=A0ABV4TZ44_9GAMM